MDSSESMEGGLFPDEYARGAAITLGVLAPFPRGSEVTYASPRGTDLRKG